MTRAFVCIKISIEPSVRHADYVGARLAGLREDNRAIFWTACQASKAADYLFAFRCRDQAGGATH